MLYRDRGGDPRIGRILGESLRSNVRAPLRPLRFGLRGTCKYACRLAGGRLSRHRRNDGGFTIIEVIVAIALSAIVSTMLYSFFVTSFNQYFALQHDGMTYSELATQSQRIAMVLRSATGITQATNTEITAYAYFSPNDTYVSQVHYYISGDGTQLLADVVPMTANPPNGTLLTGQTRNYVVVDKFYTVSGVNTFSYLGTGTTGLTVPISDLHTIKQISVSLASPTKAPSATGYDQVTVQVMLRNRKTNL